MAIDELDFANLNDEAWADVEARDEAAIKKINSAFQDNELNGIIGNVASGGAIDQANKADDAIDFEDMDLSDEDDLPEEEEATGPPLDVNDDEDDLFGDAGFRSSPEPTDGADEQNDDNDADSNAPDTDGMDIDEPGNSLEELRAMNFDFDHDPGFDETNQDPNIPAPAENLVEAVKQAYPGFRENAVLPWNELLHPKVATWISKKPPKPPKHLVPNKLSLDLEADQEKLFRIPGTASIPVFQRIREAELRGLWSLEECEPLEQADIEVFDMDDDDSDNSYIQGYTLRDIALVCDDWDRTIGLAELQNQVESITEDRHIKFEPDEDDEDDDWDRMFLDNPAAPKKRRLEIPKGLPPIPTFTAPNFDNYEEAASKLGKRVILDMNDPFLLVDDVESSERAAKRRKTQHKTVRLANGRLGRELTQRFNFSSDQAYEALKENAQSKVRATLAPIPVEHSMPAQRLSWPYYKVKLTASDPHSYHRPQFHPKKDGQHLIRFSKPLPTKRKLMRAKKIPEAFKTSADLSMNDSSTAVLLEYCEEVPIVLSNFGMGQKIVNYYRRSKGTDSNSKGEKRELGENCVLMPEDRSPFAMVGQVHPGETVPTLHNQMFRAPIFKHSPRKTDFLVGRSSTGKLGANWYIRNIDHLFVVGQILPSMEVPGPHSRRVTNIAKNRLKMVSYRLLSQSDNVTLTDITKHVAESNESQNRQKLKEFLDFRKDQRNWKLKDGQEMLAESEIRALVRPEDVCLLDAMQVGAHELENGGYEVNDNMVNDENEVGDELPPDALANKMAPWRLTKAFIDASHGKAMIAVHGAGDPTGKGLGVSYLRTSMKGGFLEQLQGPNATSADAIERQRKANGGHMYNVKNQDTLYTEALKDIWNRQRESLQDAQEHDDDDVLAQEDEDDRFNTQSQVPAHPGIADGVSQISQSHASAVGGGRKLKITRQIKDENGEIKTVEEVVHDPVVINQYLKKRRQQAMEKIDFDNLKLTGDEEYDKLLLEKAEAELERLEKNKLRTAKRTKQKDLQARMKDGGADGAGSPGPNGEKVTGTTRKCANCGQVGHIKTNKKLCPLLNGSRPREQNPDDAAGLASGNAPVAASFIL
ncbi:putative transcription initiation factor [Triangularia verruculosa]|uniref:Transcription initiation factor n=1 Tax=Triangularia verruculosa TaxID=2587418 RepID=A0AAN6X725_9PEZI|nr:putative transcription initiation factor [Triangularia verruculosa]